MNKPTRQIKLCLQEILEAKQTSYEQLSHSSGVPEEIIRSYAIDPITEISEPIANHLKAIAAVLEICVSELFQPLSNGELLSQEMTVEEWSNARSLQLNDAFMLADAPNTGTGGGTIFCDLFPNAPGC